MSKLFVFHGADRRVGVSMLAQSAAELLSQGRKDLKVLLVNLQGRYGTVYTSYTGESIERLRHHLDNRLVNKEELLDRCRCTENLYIIGGVSSIGEEQFYQPEMSAYLLSLLKGEFDIILADSGSEVGNGLALGALVMADEIFLVVTQQESVLRRYEKLKELYKKLKLSFPLIICSHFRDEDPYGKAYLARRLGVDKKAILTVAETDNGRLAEMERKTLMSYRGGLYQADVLAAANEILQRAGQPPMSRQKKGYENILSQWAFRAGGGDKWKGSI